MYYRSGQERRIALRNIVLRFIPLRAVFRVLPLRLRQRRIVLAVSRSRWYAVGCVAVQTVDWRDFVRVL